MRKSGNRLRVTAQLVKVRDGFHLWSERYDREMKDSGSTGFGPSGKHSPRVGTQM